MNQEQDISTLPSGNLAFHFSRLGSTSQEARYFFERGESGPLWVSANEQTAGYGRRGHPWRHDKGNFAATLLLPWPHSQQPPAGLALAISVAVADALVALSIPEKVIHLKWPNDILLEGKKLSGILLEWLEDKNRRSLAVGIGVNLKNAPQLPGKESTCLQAYLGPDTPSPQLFLCLIDQMIENVLKTYRQQGFPALREKWLARGPALDSPLEVRNGNNILSGTFAGLGEKGSILLATKEGAREIFAGEVSVPTEPKKPQD